MASISRGIKYILYNRSQFCDSMVKNYLSWLPDKWYLSLRYRFSMGYWIDWKNPQTFNEKLQWLKLYNRKPEYTTMVDKYAVKNYVANIIGEQYIIPTLGVWDRFEDIDFSTLPQQFVLKTTHGGGGGGVFICRDKNSFDKEEAKHIIETSMRNDIYKSLREWPYKNVPKRIIAEKFMEDMNGELRDYKFTCTNGIAHNVMLCYDRRTGDTKFYFFDKQWNLLRLNKRGKEAPDNFSLPKPINLDKMFILAQKISEGIPYSRVDLYNINGKIYFGEITFYPASGFDNNLLKETDELFGNYIKLKISSK